MVDEKYQQYVNATLEPLLKGKSLNEEETESEDDESFHTFDIDNDGEQPEPVDV